MKNISLIRLSGIMLLIWLVVFIGCEYKENSSDGKKNPGIQKWAEKSEDISQPLTAKIIVDDYKWSDNDGNQIDFKTRFPEAELTKYYAPLPVFFQGWNSVPRSLITAYEWDFGDGSPLFYGFNASHVYEIPGKYTVKLTVTDTSGKTSSSTITVEVLERAGNVYYVDSDIGNDEYDGLSQSFNGGKSGPWKSADRAFSEMTGDLYKSGDSILFKRGQKFDLTVSKITPQAWPAWGYMFAAYGSGDKPVIQYKGENGAIIIHMYSIGLAHVSFVDLDFRFDDYSNHKAGAFFFAQGGGTRNILFLRVDALDLYSDLFCIGKYAKNEISSGTFVFDTTIRNTKIDPEKSVTLFAVWGSRFACINSTFDLSGNHIGYTAIDKGVISGNTFSRPAFGRTALRVCGFQETGENWDRELTSNNVQISDNYFHGWIDPETVGEAHNGGGNRYNYRLLQLAPNGDWNQVIRDITFERNIITNGEGMMGIGAAENIIVKNNKFISNDSSGISYFISIVEANKPSRNITISDNTFAARNSQYTGNIYEMSGIISVLSNDRKVPHPFTYNNHRDIKIKNNIFYIEGENTRSRFIYVNEISEVLPQIKSDNNLFYVSKGTLEGEFFQIGNAGLKKPSAQYLTLSQWQNITGQDRESIYADPMFIDLRFSEYGFHANLDLNTGSPFKGK